MMLTASFPSKASIHSFLSSSENACMVTGTPGLKMHQTHRVTLSTSNLKSLVKFNFQLPGKAHFPKIQGWGFLCHH